MSRTKRDVVERTPSAARPLYRHVGALRAALVGEYGLLDPHGEGGSMFDRDFTETERRAAEYFWPPAASFEEFLLFALKSQTDFLAHDGVEFYPHLDLDRMLLVYFADRACAPYEPIARLDWAHDCAEHHA